MLETLLLWSLWTYWLRFLCQLWHAITSNEHRQQVMNDVIQLWTGIHTWWDFTHLTRLFTHLTRLYTPDETVYTPDETLHTWRDCLHTWRDFTHLITHLTKVFTHLMRLFLRGERFRRIPTNGFRSSGDKSAFDEWMEAMSRRVGRTFLIGLWASCDVTNTSHAVELTSAEVDLRSTVPGSPDVRGRLSSTDEVKDGEAEVVGCSCWVCELATNLFSGRLNERHVSPRTAVTRHFTNISIINCTVYHTPHRHHCSQGKDRELAS